MLSPLDCLSAKAGGAVNGGAYAPFILTVDWLGWLCYYKEGVPFPSPSNAPEEVTETAETINPAPMMRKAVSPAWIVASVWVNSPISWPGISRHIAGSKHHNDTAHAQNNPDKSG